MNSLWFDDRLGGVAIRIFSSSVNPRFGLLFLLDDDGQPLSQVYERLVQAGNLACVVLPPCPAWWNDRLWPAFHPTLSAEQFVLKEIVPLFQSRWNLRPRALAIAGIGLGGQGALRLALRHPEVFPIVAAIAPSIDYHELYGGGGPLDELYDSKEQCRQDTAIMAINPYQNPPHLFFGIDPEDAAWTRGNDRLHEKLNALGVGHVADFTTSGGGHSWDYYNRQAEPIFKFILDGLDKESRRLL